MNDLWDWFLENEPEIRRIATSGNLKEQAWLKEQLDQYILSIGRFSWEINSGETKTYELVISPNRDHELYKLSKKTVAEAPELIHWDFLPAKKANLELAPFELYDDTIELRSFEPKKWVVKKEGQSVKVYDASFEKIDYETCLFAAQIGLASYMGEEQYMTEVKSIQPTHLALEGGSNIQSLLKK